MMDLATGRPNWRSAAAKAVAILIANLLVAATVIGPIALLAGADPFHPGSVAAGWAAFVGILHLTFGATALAMRASARFLDDAEEADDLRREGRALLLGGGALIAAGASMVLLSLSAPASALPPRAALAGTLSLTLIAMILVGLRYRLLDELNRSVAKEAGALALTWFSVVAGTWGMVAHVGLAEAPAPLEWLTMLWGFSFVAGLVALARRGGFDTPGADSAGGREA